jgi:hypothetical protein
VRRAGNRLVKLQRVAPERLVAERVMPKDPPSLIHHEVAVREDRVCGGWPLRPYDLAQ